MRPTDLATTPLRAPVVLSPTLSIEANRQAFWRAYLSWQSDADDADLASLAQALEPHAQHVRPIHQAIGAALLDPSTMGLLPTRLLWHLESAGWRVERTERPTLPLAA